jgi:hypothetical protein
MVSLMYGKKVMTTGLAVLAIVTALSLVTSSGSGLVTSAFAVKKGNSDKSGTSSNKSGSSTSKRGTSGTSSSTSTGSKSKFIKCITSISGSPSRAEVDNCWDQVFGGGSSSGLTLGGSGSSTLGGSSSASSRTGSGSSGHEGASTSVSNT